LRRKKIEEKVRVPAIPGIFLIIDSPLIAKVAARRGRTVFFEPEICTVPLNFFPLFTKKILLFIFFVVRKREKFIN